ncbi:MAG: hypothetical protein J0H14_19260 [Alphaproteobacteria bacterium]|nr:hypothetical protein [Alphaproteobacteria bacterium]
MQRLARHGSDMAHWPESERKAALRLLRRSAAARRRYLAALDDDPGMGAEAAQVDPAVIARMVAGARRATSVEVRRSASIRHIQLPLPAMRWGALAACAVLGVWVGWTATATAPPPTLLASVQITPMLDSSP